ncbi:dynamin central region family protein [Vairimorpha apis BRL 01]|uniref:Dynamin central region family protein n=1 Tax=Vairimorpha apis BRL 01 TaxID=1037528 RepID=T0L8K8_9MICR|nr:dynamin central region family protein [Vairimorpha apis BRL 01]
MDKNTNCLQILKNEKYYLKCGYVGVINKSQTDINNKISFKEIELKEKNWFLNSVYKNLDNIGNKYLVNKVKELFVSRCRDLFPCLKSVICEKICVLEDELKSYEFLWSVDGERILNKGILSGNENILNGKSEILSENRFDKNDSILNGNENKFDENKEILSENEGILNGNKENKLDENKNKSSENKNNNKINSFINMNFISNPIESSLISNSTNLNSITNVNQTSNKNNNQIYNNINKNSNNFNQIYNNINTNSNNSNQIYNSINKNSNTIYNNFKSSTYYNIKYAYYKTLQSLLTPTTSNLTIFKYNHPTITHDLYKIFNTIPTNYDFSTLQNDLKYDQSIFINEEILKKVIKTNMTKILQTTLTLQQQFINTLKTRINSISSPKLPTLSKYFNTLIINQLTKTKINYLITQYCNINTIILNDNTFIKQNSTKGFFTTYINIKNNFKYDMIINYSKWYLNLQINNLRDYVIKLNLFVIQDVFENECFKMINCVCVEQFKDVGKWLGRVESILSELNILYGVCEMI